MLEGTIQYLLIYSPQLESLSPVLTKRNANDGCVKCFGNVKQILALPYQVSAKCTKFSLTFVLLIAWKILWQTVVPLSSGLSSPKY